MFEIFLGAYLQSRDRAVDNGAVDNGAVDNGAGSPEAGRPSVGVLSVQCPVDKSRIEVSAAEIGLDVEGFLESCELTRSGYGRKTDRVVALAKLRSRIEGEYVAALGEMTAECGAQAAAHLLRELTRMSSAQARKEARLAHDLTAQHMTDTVEAMRHGQIHMSHARVIAREAPKQHRRSEEEFLGLCRVYPCDKVAKHTLAYESEQVYADLAAEAAAEGLGPIDAEAALQAFERRGSMRCGHDGMWRLSAKLDAITGRQVNIAIQAAVRAARHKSSDATTHDTSTGIAELEDADSNGVDADGVVGECPVPTRAQLTADAIADLLLAKPSARRTDAKLVIVADYDTVNKRLANPRLDDGTPISARMLAQHAIDAEILPAVFKADWSQLALGRSRNANDAQRLILAMRDQGCIGCDLPPEHTQAHHIHHYENGGTTDIDNLASLCEPCHTNLHQHNHTIRTQPNPKPQLQPLGHTTSGKHPPEPGGNDPP